MPPARAAVLDVASTADVGRRRPFYGWVLVGTLSLTEPVSYGILTYAFAVFLGPMERELGWSRTAATGAYSFALLVAGAAAIPAGRWVDRHGARGLMTAGSCAAASGVFAWSRVQSLPALYAVWTLIGLAMAAVLYEPAFAVIATWFVRGRSRALTVLTFAGGFASIVFVPLSAALVRSLGWRNALAALAAMLLILTALPHALLLRRHPADLGLRPDGDPLPRAPDEAPAPHRSVSTRQALSAPGFRWLAAAFGLGTLASSAVTVHLVSVLVDRGFRAGFAAAVLGTLGVMALPGRLVFTPLGARWPRAAITAAIFTMQAAGVLVLLTTHAPTGVWIFAALFGAGSGAITPARAALLADAYGPASFGSINGALALLVSIARAAGPVGASLVLAGAGGYAPVLGVLLAASTLAAAAVLLSGRGAASPSTATASIP